jgi:methylthioribulose-1-phosphate dehydratase
MHRTPAACAQAIAATGAKLAARGLTPATSVIFPFGWIRHAAVTISGRDKGALTADDIMVVDMHDPVVGDGATIGGNTAAHADLRTFSEATRCCIRIRAQTVASRLYAERAWSASAATNCERSRHTA